MFDKSKTKALLTENIGNVSVKHILYIFLFLIVFYFIIWVVIAKKASWTIISYIDDLRDKQINIAFDDYRNTGFPFSFGTKIYNFIYRNNLKSFALKTDALLVKSALSDSNKITVQLPNDMFFLRLNSRPKDTKIDSYRYQLGVRADNTQIDLWLKDSNLHNVYFKSSNGIIQTNTSPDTFSYRLLEWNIKESQVIIEDDITNILEMNFNTANIEPPPLWKRILKDNFLSLTGKIYLINPSHFRELPDFYKFIFRDYDASEIVIDNVKLIHTLSELTLGGVLKFDKDMTLNGDLVLKVSNYKKLLHFLTKKGVITATASTKFRFMLSFLQTTQAVEKTDHTVDIDLKIIKNAVYQDKIKLFDIKI